MDSLEGWQPESTKTGAGASAANEGAVDVVFVNQRSVGSVGSVELLWRSGQDGSLHEVDTLEASARSVHTTYIGHEFVLRVVPPVTTAASPAQAEVDHVVEHAGEVRIKDGTSGDLILMITKPAPKVERKEGHMEL